MTIQNPAYVNAIADLAAARLLARTAAAGLPWVAVAELIGEFGLPIAERVLTKVLDHVRPLVPPSPGS